MSIARSLVALTLPLLSEAFNPEDSYEYLPNHYLDCDEYMFTPQYIYGSTGI